MVSGRGESSSAAERPPTAVILAAGAGRRLGGRPKALLRLRSGESLVEHAVAVAREGGCRDVVVVVGAEAAAVRAACPSGVRVVEAADWTEGLGASLRAGLAAVPAGAAALILLVDTPGVSAAAVRRLRDVDQSPDALAAATYAGRRGHPVLIGPHHIPGVTASAVGDAGARRYLADHPPRPVPCEDVAAPDDVDTAEDWARWTGGSPA